MNRKTLSLAVGIYDRIKEVVLLKTGPLTKLVLSPRKAAVGSFILSSHNIVMFYVSTM